jgi:hypothetical protein
MQPKKESVLRPKICLPLVAVLSAWCSGCSRAPSVDVLGSFFPAWMLCISLGIAAAGLTRSLLVRFGMEKDIPFLVVFYPSVTVVAACLLWLTLFS